MDKAKPLVKTLILGLTSLVAILGLILIPMMNCSKPAKAAGTDSYLLLEYIESDGDQYIDTGVTAGATTRATLDFRCSSVPSAYQVAMGVYDGTNYFYLGGFYLSSSVFYTRQGNSTTNLSTITADTNRHTSINDVLNKYVSNDSTSATGNTWGTSTSKNIYLFAYNNNGVNSNASVRVYSSQIYTNGVLVRDFVPVKRSSDGVLGLLDRVNGVFYANQGTGSFTAGYLANDYYVCDFIDFNRTDTNQYIDTGFVPSNTSDVIITGKYLSTPTAQSYLASIFDNSSGTTNRYYLGTWFTSGNILNMYGTSTTNVPGILFNQAARYTAELNPLHGFGAINSTVQTFTPAGGNYSTSLSIAAQHNNSGNYYAYLDARIYSFSAFNNGSIQRNMIPVYDPSTRKASMFDLVNKVLYNNGGDGDFVYNITGSPTIYQVSTENALNSALTASVGGDLIILSDNIALSSQTINVGNAPVYWEPYSLGSSDHPNIAFYSVEGWYSSQWSEKASNGKLDANTTYYARFQTDVNSSTIWGFVLSNSVSGDIINITAGFSYTTTSFTIPANVTVNKNGNIILPPVNAPMSPVGYNADASASTDTTTYVANTTYYAIYVIPTYTVRLIIDPEVAINISGLAGATRTEYASYSSIDFSYNYGQSIQFPLPTLNLHSFNGWWLNGTTGAYSGISSTDYGNKVFYARWVEAPEITIGNVNIFRNLISNGDRLIMFTSNIDWQNLPNNNVRTMFMFRLMDSDGSTVLASAQPYYAYNGGYYLQAVGFYFPDDSVIEWGGEYQIRIDGNPSQWYTISDVREIYNISGVDYTEASSPVDNQTELAAWIVNITQLLENDWLNYISIAPLITTDSNGNQVLTKTGQTYYLNTIANINNMAPSLFSGSTVVTPINPDNPMPEIPASPSLITRWENQYEGTWVQDSFQALGDLFHVSWRMITSILCLVLWVVFAAISQMRWGTTDAGLWMGAVMFGVMVTMGLMNWAVVITAAILMSLYSLYIVFWRQG